MRLLFFLGLVLVAVPSPARAQETGGSFGGGSFGGSGSGGGSGGGGGGGSSSSSSPSPSSYPSSSSSSWSGSSSSGATGGSTTRGDPGFVLVLAFLFVVVVVFMLITARAQQAREFRNAKAERALLDQVGPVAPMAAFTAATDVSALSLAIDWRARRFLQSTFARLAREGDTKSNAGLARLLAESARTLLSVETAWLYASALNAVPMQTSNAQMAFSGCVSDARARFKRELVRNENGALTEADAGPLRAKPTEGEGVVVVTLVAAARRELKDVRAVRDATELKALLTQLAALGSDLVAMEVIWSPAAEDDRMSSAELEALYPDLIKLDESSLVGRVFCEYCHGPYPRELGTCPHCGAPGGRH